LKYYATTMDDCAFTFRSWYETLCMIPRYPCLLLV
jgi:hypothetical protein